MVEKEKRRGRWGKSVAIACKFTIYNLRFRLILCHLRTISSLPALPTVWPAIILVENNAIMQLSVFVNNVYERGKKFGGRGLKVWTFELDWNFATVAILVH